MKRNAFIGPILMSIALYGCSTRVVNSATHLVGVTASEVDSVAIFPWGTDAPEPHTVLGSVYSYRHAGNRFINPSMKDINRDLSEQAKTMGADGIAHLVSGDRDHREDAGFAKWGIGVAIRRDGLSVDGPAVCTSCIVELAFSAADTSKIAGYDMKEERKIRQLIVHPLAEKGYYLIPAHGQRADGDFEDLDKLDQVPRHEHPVPTSRLEIEVLDAKSGFNIGIAASKNYWLRGKLVLIGSGDILWESDAATSAGGFSLVNALGAGGKARIKAAEQLFSSLPDLRNPEAAASESGGKKRTRK